MIEAITRYRFDGKEFDDLDKVARYVEDEIGKVIDSTPIRLVPQDALAVYNAIIAHRKRPDDTCDHVDWLVTQLNALAQRLPRITTTLVLQTIPIDLLEIVDDFGVLKQSVTFSGDIRQPSMNFVNLLSGVCPPYQGITWKLKDGVVVFSRK